MLRWGKASALDLESNSLMCSKGYSNGAIKGSDLSNSGILCSIQPQATCQSYTHKHLHHRKTSWVVTLAILACFVGAVSPKPPSNNTHTHTRTHTRTAQENTKGCDLSNSDILCVAFSLMSPTATHTRMYSTEKHQGLWPQHFWHTLCSIQPHVTYCHTHTHVQHRKTPRAVTSAFLTYFV